MTEDRDDVFLVTVDDREENGTRVRLVLALTDEFVSAYRRGEPAPKQESLL